MNQRTIKIAVCAGFLVVMGSSPLFGQSVFGSFGIGELQYHANTRSVGMGGAGLALTGPISPNQLNPASWVSLVSTSYSVGIRIEGLRFEQANRSSEARQGELNNVTFASRFSSRFALGGGFRSISSKNFNITSDMPEYTRTIDGSGGLSAGYFGFAYRLNRKISLGAVYNYLAGADTETWGIDFTENGQKDTSGKFIRKKRGAGFTLGAIVAPSSWLWLGGVYFSRAVLKTKNEVSTIAEFQSNVPGEEIILPHSFGVGFASQLKPGVIVAGDVYRWQYRDLDMGLKTPQEFRNSTRYSGGVEFSPGNRTARGGLKMMSYRIGGFYWDLYPADLDGSTVTEKFLTAGLSIPFNSLQTRFDIGIEAGLRSSASEALGSEKIIRAYINLVGMELWYLRRTQR